MGEAGKYRCALNDLDNNWGSLIDKILPKKEEIVGELGEISTYICLFLA